ncbi:GNAT family N-acetyltransferase [Isoptericola sp. S6320L]|uniref:GNAT family N-acetyltransferase n=1 Tax=Isoptericola sp. S6320L TaxID=2926411 RepID=UPI001FF1A2D2|nr:N-acetyltransferase [Isoptericola sp. S6320L]MCK0116259.1 GNAT family N-acetyltransferase [Isoptericola sp. S6320L]
MTAEPVVVRAARPQEAAEIAWLAALTFPLACPEGTPVPTMAAHVAAHLTPAHFAAWSGSAEHLLLVAESGDDSGSLVGYTLLAVGEPAGPDELAALRSAVGPGPYVELSKIYVHPDHLGHGTAGRMLTTATSEAQRLAPGRPFWLGTNGQNARAQSFYRRHGFTVIGRRTYDVGGVQHDDVVMLQAPAE